MGAGSEKRVVWEPTEEQLEGYREANRGADPPPLEVGCWREGEETPAVAELQMGEPITLPADLASIALTVPEIREV